MKIVCVSDTHGKHLEISVSTVGDEKYLKSGDILIHCGDISKRYDTFSDLLNKMKFRYIILVPGNRDVMKKFSKLFYPKNNIICLNNSCCFIEGLYIYGHPYCNVNKARGSRQVDFEGPLIPDNLDILVTHAPPRYILDLSLKKPKMNSRVSKISGFCESCKCLHPDSYHWGNLRLRGEVLNKKPNFHIFGHVHYSPGEFSNGETKFINCASTLHKKLCETHMSRSFEISENEMRNKDHYFSLFNINLNCFLEIRDNVVTLRRSGSFDLDNGEIESETEGEDENMLSKKKNIERWKLLKEGYLRNESGGFLCLTKSGIELMKVKDFSNSVSEVIMKGITKWKYYNDIIFTENCEKVLDIRKMKIVCVEREEGRYTRWRFW